MLCSGLCIYNVPIVMTETTLLISDAGAMADATPIPALWKAPTPSPIMTVYPYRAEFDMSESIVAILKLSQEIMISHRTLSHWIEIERARGKTYS
jgi:hypothetical protein